MSSMALRSWFRQQVVARVPTIPYLDTINKIEQTKNLPDVWCTLEFVNAVETRVSLGSRACFRETGEVQIVVLGKSGKGDGPVVTAAELFREAFFAVRESVTYGADSGWLIIDSAQPPNTDSTENGNWFLASVSCAYTFDTVRGT